MPNPLDTRTSGFALVAGICGGILTMAIHPVGIAGITLDQARHLSLVSAIAHSLGIVSFLAVFLGACGLTRHLASRTLSSLPFSALVVFALACISIFLAAAIDGFIVPRLLLYMLHDDPAYIPQWHIVITAVFQFNQSFAQIYSVAASVSLVLWSLSALRTGTLPRPLALYGAIAPSLLIALILMGHIRLDVHGMLAIILVQAVWLIAAGVHLLRTPTVA